MNAEAKEEGERKGTLRDVCGAGGAYELHPKFSGPTNIASYINNQ